MADTPEDRGAFENGDEPEKRYWLDDIRNVHKIFWALVIVCAVLFVSDAFLQRKSAFFFEEWFGFFGLFGFSLSFLLVLTAKELRKILKRDEDFYDR